MAWFDLLISKPSGLAAAAILLLYVVGILVHRLYLSPVAKFPGPRLAAATFWYEFYYDVVKRGQYTWEIRKMHQKYGPIVRINPYELHIDDPDFYDEVYPGPSRKCDKWDWSAKMFGNTTSVVGTVPHDLHRMRRTALNPYFSKQSVVRLEQTISSLVNLLCERLREFQKSREPVNLGVAYSALTTDIITDYCFGKPYGFLKTPDFAPEWPATMIGVAEISHLLKQVSWLYPLMQAMPMWFVSLTSPQMLPLMNFQQNITAQIRAIMDGKNQGNKRCDHRTIFHELLNSDLPPTEKSLHRLVDEGETVVAAGTITTQHAMKTISFHLLANPEILRKLKDELQPAMPDPGILAPLQELEQLPLLSAIISEGLRISHAVSSRLARVSPDTSLVWDKWKIPPGTPVSMTSVFVHENPEIFPEPRQFRPDRWLQGSSSERLKKYLVPFSKGTRACLGINLAYAELYLTLAAVFRRFDLELYETTVNDVEVVHDFFNPSVKLDSKGVRVLVK